jgi:hypothetical protein
MATKKITLNELRNLVKQIIKEEYNKENTNEIFGFFNKSQEPKAVDVKVKKITPGEITIEGIDARGKGYSVWSGNNPLGDLRGMIRKYNENSFDEITINGNVFDYYFVIKQNSKSTIVPKLEDHVGRPAYFTVSALKGSVDKNTLKKIADDILNKNKKGIINY